MDDKNELNDLLLGNQKESGSSKKFFLIAAGVLLLFFIIIGIMKFMGSSETKQPLPITSAEQTKKLPEAAAQAVVSTTDANISPNTNTTATGDEKLNAIVKKLQQDAQTQATTVAPPAQTSAVAATPSTAVAVPVTKQAPQTQQAPKTTVITVPIKTAPVEQPQKIKETVKKEDVKTAFKDATKNIAKPKPQPQKQAVKQADAKPKAAAAASGTHFIQVGYFESEASAKGLRDKVNSVGFGSTTRQAVKNDKNITKVWVGPFESKEDAAKALPKIREQIKSDAFVIKG